MATRTARGSIILEIAILLMIGALVLSLYIPRMIWDIEKEETIASRRWMLHLWTAQTVYKSKTDSYAETADQIIALAMDDTSVSNVLNLLYTSSIFRGNDSIQVILEMPLDSLRACPLSGFPFRITLTDTIPALTIACPADSGTKPFYLFGNFRMPGAFSIQLQSSGNIVDGKVSWEEE